MNAGLSGSCSKGIPVRRVLCHSLIEATEVPDKGMRISQNLQKFRVRERTCYRTHKRSAQESKCCTRTPGICGTGVQILQKFQVRVLLSYRICRSSGYGHERPTELITALCRIIPGVNTQGMVLYALQNTTLQYMYI